MIKIKRIEARPDGVGSTYIKMLVDRPYSELAQTIETAKVKPYQIDMKPYREKRSLEANAYYQVLLDKLSHKVGVSRDVIHQEMLRDYGVTDRFSNGDPALISLKKGLDPHEIYKYVEWVRDDVIRGTEVSWWRFIKPSSKMDTYEFSKLLDGLISECNQNGIDTATPEELARMKNYAHKVK